ncbi:MAG TPA: protein adenylyltransferase SelO family protein, partial [Acidobacteriaceae bacterium]|nr:protein adenylyltransferase SelO family protein [Acidobacteriaceae bacterium]
NLARLAEALLALLEQEEGSEEAAIASAQEALSVFAPQFEAAYVAGLRRKLGLLTEREGDAGLAQDLLERMAANRADFTLTFRRLSYAAAGPNGDEAVRALFVDPSAYDIWAVAWRRRLEEEGVSAQERVAAMKTANPAFIPRNHLVQAVIDAAVQHQDFQSFEDLLEVVSRPYEDRPGLERYSTPARPEECVLQTFCGT